MEYKVGDRVKIKSLDWYNENKDKKGYVNCSARTFVSGMAQFCGKVVTIEEAFKDIDDNRIYTMEGIYYDWTDEMIEGLVEEKVITTNEPLSEIANIPLEKEMEWKLPDGYQFVDENGNIINATKIVLEKKKKEYPKTYEECAKELGYNQVMPKDHILGYMGTLLSVFQQLLICRDAYWKIAGEEMGLEKPWEPSKDKMVYSIYRHSNEIETDCFSGESVTFEFPTEEIRDTFKENFDKDLEFCKELL